MSSGVGFHGGVSPCYEFWHGFTQCYRTAANPAECKLHQADFHECLHKRNQKFRIAKAMIHITEEAKPKKPAGAAAPGGH